MTGLYLQHICWLCTPSNNRLTYQSVSDISRIESFVNIMKSKGPSIEPCGTPIFT